MGRNLAAVDGWGVAWSGKGIFPKRCSPPKVAFGSDWGGTSRCRSSIGSGSISPHHFVLFFDLPLTLSFSRRDAALLHRRNCRQRGPDRSPRVENTTHERCDRDNAALAEYGNRSISRRDFVARDLRATVAGTGDGLDCTKLWK